MRAVAMGRGAQGRRRCRQVDDSAYPICHARLARQPRNMPAPSGGGGRACTWGLHRMAAIC